MAVDSPAAELPGVTDRLRRQAVRGGTLLLAARLGTQIFQWTVTLFVTRLLLPDDYGMMTAGVMFVGLADMLAEAGVGKALVHQKDLTGADLAQGFTLGLILSAGLYLLLFLLAPAAAVFQHQAEFATFLRVLGLLLFLVPLRSVAGALLERNLLLGRQSAVQLGGAVIQATLVLSLALAGLGYWALAAGTLAARLLEALSVWYASGWRPEIALPARRAWGLLRYGVHVSGATLLWFIYNNADFAAVDTFEGGIRLGFYAVAFQLMTMPVQKLSSHVNHIMFSVFCRIQDDRARVRDWFLRLTVLLTFVIAPALAGLALVAGDGLPLLLGERWREAVLPFQLLCPVGILMVVSSALHQTFAALGRPDVTLKYNVVCAVLMPVGFFVAAAFWGQLGVCVVWLTFTPVLFAVLLWLTQPLTGIGIADVVRAQLPVLAGVAVLAVCVLAARSSLREDSSSAARLGVGIAAGVASYTAWMLVTARNSILADLKTVWHELRGRTPQRDVAA
jgi:O-antigen/teichoic acid export membrane protein